MKRLLFAGLAAWALLLVGTAAGSTPGADVRLTNDCHPDAACGAGYVSDYTLATGIPYTDPTLNECSISHGRQNEPAVAVDPRNTNVLLGSSNDYCGVYNRTTSSGVPLPVGPIWLGYYRSQDGGRNFVSSLVPGYPDDTSTLGALARIRTAIRMTPRRIARSRRPALRQPAIRLSPGTDTAVPSSAPRARGIPRAPRRRSATSGLHVSRIPADPVRVIRAATGSRTAGRP
jgi:hypothetical protein